MALYTNGIYRAAGNQYNGGIVQSNYSLVNGIVSGSGDYWHVSQFDCPITPCSTSNKVLILVSLGSVSGESNTQGFQVRRNGSEIDAMRAASNGSRPRLTFRGARNWSNDSNHTEGAHIIMLDSPSTTSTVTYRLYAKGESNSTLYINRTQNNTNGGDAYQGNTCSSMTVFEIAD